MGVNLSLDLHSLKTVIVLLENADLFTFLVLNQVGTDDCRSNIKIADEEFMISFNGWEVIGFARINFCFEYKLQTSMRLLQKAK